MTPPAPTTADAEKCGIRFGDYECSFPVGHIGLHHYVNWAANAEKFKCAGEYCPGYPWKASDSRHPNTCTIPPAPTPAGSEGKAGGGNSKTGLRCLAEADSALPGAVDAPPAREETITLHKHEYGKEWSRCIPSWCSKLWEHADFVPASQLAAAKDALEQERTWRETAYAACKMAEGERDALREELRVLRENK